MFSIATMAGPDGAAGVFRRFGMERAEVLAPRASARGKRGGKS